MSSEALELKEQAEEASKSWLNSMVAVTIAILATFMGITGIKASNVDQGMRAAQTEKIDNWAWYQARNIRQEVMLATAAQMRAHAVGSPARDTLIKEAVKYEGMADSQEKKKSEQDEKAREAEKEYSELSYKDDQFDLSDALLSVAIAMLALAALTQKGWLFWLSLLPSAAGIVVGLAGLLGWPVDAGPIIRFLG